MKKSKKTAESSNATRMQQEFQRVEASATASNRNRRTGPTRDSFASTKSDSVDGSFTVSSEAASSETSQSKFKESRGETNVIDPSNDQDCRRPSQAQIYATPPSHLETSKPRPVQTWGQDHSDSDDDFPGSLFEALNAENSSNAGNGRGKASPEKPFSRISTSQDSQMQRFKQPPQITNTQHASVSFSLNDIMECVEIV
jgi:hypothetical protein